MSNKKLERILELLINEDTKKAEELLHEFMVSKARAIYEDIVADEEQIEDEDEELDESVYEADDELGGDPSVDFTYDIEADKDDIESDEELDGEPEVDKDDVFGDDEEEEAPIEDRVADLESELDSLRAEFEALMAEEAGEEEHQGSDLFADVADDELDLGDDLQDDLGDVEEGMFEATQFQKAVAKPSNTGGADPAAQKAPFTAPTKKTVVGKGEPVDFTKGEGGAYGKYNGEKAKNDTTTDNIKVEPKTAPKAKSKPSGEDSKAVSPLTKVAEAKRRK